MCLTAKGYNQAMISKWLWAVCSKRMSSELEKARATMMYGFVLFYHICSTSGMELSLQAARELGTARHSLLAGYNKMTALATENVWPMFPSKPKLHKMDHCLRQSLATRLNPGFTWCFQDEDLVGRMSTLAVSVHGRSIARRTIQRWMLVFFSELE